MTYETTADALVERIVALGPKVLEVSDAFDLFEIGLKCDDLEPSLFHSLFQAQWALSVAKKRLREAKEPA